MGGYAGWGFTRIGKLFINYYDNGTGKKLKNVEQHFLLFHYHLQRWEFTQIHEFFNIYYDDGEWEDMPYEDMESMEEN